MGLNNIIKSQCKNHFTTQNDSSHKHATYRITQNLRTHRTPNRAPPHTKLKKKKKKKKTQTKHTATKAPLHTNTHTSITKTKKKRKRKTNKPKNQKQNKAKQKTNKQTKKNFSVMIYAWIA